MDYFQRQTSQKRSVEMKYYFQIQCILPFEEEHIDACQKKSWAKNEKRRKAKNEQRNVSLKEIIHVVNRARGKNHPCGQQGERARGKKYIPLPFFAKMEKEDPALSGIVAGKTTVFSPKHGNRTVVSFDREKGYWVYTIEWGRKSTPDGKYSTHDVLKEANDGKTATLEETYRSMINYACVVLDIVNIHVHEIVKDDLRRKVDKHDLSGWKEMLLLMQTRLRGTLGLKSRT